METRGIHLSADVLRGRRWWQQLIEVAAYPGIVLGAVVAGILLFDLGWSKPIVVPAVIMGAGALILVLESVHPYVAEWRISRDGLRTDLLHTVFSTGGVQVIIEASLMGVLVAVGARLTTPGLAAWPSDWPIAYQLGAALLVVELQTYWIHRGFHTIEPAWKVHAVHHSSDQLYILASGRNHPINVALMAAAQLAPLVVLGAPEQIIALSALFTGVHGMIQHANVEMRVGPLNWFMSSPDLHRWHHARVVEDANANFGNNLIVWDVIFGTRFLPGDRAVPRTAGIEGMSYPESYLAQLASPFVFKTLYSS